MANVSRILLVTAFVALVLIGFHRCGEPPMEVSFSPTEEVLYNPLTGFAPSAGYDELVGENTLVYFEVLWKDISPEEGVYDFSGVEEKNNLQKWRQEGKHAVMRFVCDKPGNEPHVDIPKWLYEKTGDGTHYSYNNGERQGYSPNYENPVLIEAHTQAIQALGDHFDDGFVCFVELGSLGHWGEWHVNTNAGIAPLPDADVRAEYVRPYPAAFPWAKFLMRRPFDIADEFGFGVYNDMAGHPESTQRWMDWIAHGGSYDQTGEEHAMMPMPDAWQCAPIGGELTSSMPMTEMLKENLEETLHLIRQSHTTFLGPKIPNHLRDADGLGGMEEIDRLRSSLGYRLRVAKAEFKLPHGNKSGVLKLTWTNDGCAPFYWEWPMCIYLIDQEKRVILRKQLPASVTEILPGESLNCTLKAVTTRDMERGAYLCVGIEDPQTGEPAVTLAMEAERIGLCSVLYEFDMSGSVKTGQ